MSSLKKPNYHSLVIGPQFALMLLLALMSSYAFGQTLTNKKPESEFIFGIGTSNFLGELGGRDREASNFIWDLELPLQRQAVNIAFRKFVTKRSAVRVQFQYGAVSGDDQRTAELFRNNRNLHFRSTILELYAVYEFHLFTSKLRRRFDLRDNRQKIIGTRGSSKGIYLFGGIGGFNFKSQAKYQGVWLDLRPLGTEGQGLPGGPDPYSSYSVSFPLGGGIRWSRRKRFVLSLELSHHFTLTDYIDDVSGTYYDNEALRQLRGEASAELADPQLGLEGTSWEEGKTPGGVQRGDSSDNDGFLFLNLNFAWKIARGPTYNRFNYRKSKRSRPKF